MYECMFKKKEEWLHQVGLDLCHWLHQVADTYVFKNEE